MIRPSAVRLGHSQTGGFESFHGGVHTVLLYDLTNRHFEGLCPDNPKAKRGANKQKRNDCAQIVVGMVFNQYGFEMAHKVFEGNRNDGKSLVEMIVELNAAAEPGKGKPLVVMDAGVATRKNLNLLREHGFGYLVNDSRGQRQRYREAFRQELDSRWYRDGKARPRYEYA